MKISGLQNQSLQQLYKKQIERSERAGLSSSQNSPGQKDTGDSVELSANAQLLQKVLLELQKSSDTPAERLEALRRQVQDDSYDVSLQKLTDQLFNELL